jgi:hypothetical protein
VEPSKLKPTWRNKRVGEDRVAKRIDRFVVSKKFVERQVLIKQWIGSGGESDHFPIFLEVRKGNLKPTSPFKFNNTWIKDESFINLVKDNWTPYNPLAPKSTTF